MNAAFKFQHITDASDAEINDRISSVLLKNKRAGKLKPMLQETIVSRVIGHKKNEMGGMLFDHQMALRALRDRVWRLVASHRNTVAVPGTSFETMYAYQSDEEAAAVVAADEERKRKRELRDSLIASHPDMELQVPRSCAGHVAVPVDVLQKLIELAARA